MPSKGKRCQKFMMAIVAVWVMGLLLGSSLAPQPVWARDIYRIGPGDIIDIRVWREDQVTRDGLLVRPDGYISLPLVDDVKAAGMTPMELKKRLTEALGQYLAKPRVYVVVKEPNSHSVSVLGNVIKPGQYNMTKPTNVLQALAMAGGFNEWASKDNVIVVRTLGYQTTQPDRFKIQFEEKKTKEAASGEKSAPAAPEKATGELGLAAADGTKPEADKAAAGKTAKFPQVRVTRQGPEQVIHHFSYSDVISSENIQQNIQLEPGDVVVVP